MSDDATQTAIINDLNALISEANSLQTTLTAVLASAEMAACAPILSDVQAYATAYASTSAALAVLVADVAKLNAFGNA